MGDTRCKHCGAIILRWVTENMRGESIDEWRHLTTNSLFCRKSRATPEGHRRG